MPFEPKKTSPSELLEHHSCAKAVNAQRLDGNTAGTRCDTHDFVNGAIVPYTTVPFAPCPLSDYSGIYIQIFFYGNSPKPDISTVTITLQGPPAFISTTTFIVGNTRGVPGPSPTRSGQGALPLKLNLEGITFQAGVGQTVSGLQVDGFTLCAPVQDPSAGKTSLRES